MDRKHHCSVCFVDSNGLWIFYPASPPHNRQEDNRCHRCWLSSDSLSFQIRQLMLNADRFSGTQSQVHQRTLPQRYSPKIKKQNSLLIYSISSPQVHTCLMLLTKWRQCVVSKEEVIVLFLFFTGNTFSLDNAWNDHAEQICICLLFIMNITVSHKIVVAVLTMQGGLKTAQAFAKEKESHTNSVMQLYFIYSFTLTHHLFFCLILFVYYKGRQKMASSIQVIWEVW